ncbi:hypothetical protein SALBM311S_06542 [Streptomyces alboniger]
MEDRADAYREAQARMERARKAEAVAPALELREAADSEHRRAAAAEAQARALLRDAVDGAREGALGNTHGDALGDVQTEAESGIRPAAAFGEGRGGCPDGGRRADTHAPLAPQAAFADAGAVGLAAAARRAAEELGGLESARRAERRLADLVAETC